MFRFVGSNEAYCARMVGKPLDVLLEDLWSSAPLKREREWQVMIAIHSTTIDTYVCPVLVPGCLGEAVLQCYRPRLLPWVFIILRPTEDDDLSPTVPAFAGQVPIV